MSDEAHVLIAASATILIIWAGLSGGLDRLHGAVGQWLRRSIGSLSISKVPNGGHCGEEDLHNEQPGTDSTHFLSAP